MEEIKQKAHAKVERESIGDELADWLDHRRVAKRALARWAGTEVENDWKTVVVALDELVARTKNRLGELVND